MKDSETAATQMSQYHKKYDQRLKDMEGQLERSRNQYAAVNRQLRVETGRKVKFEQEIRRNEVCLLYTIYTMDASTQKLDLTLILDLNA